MNKKNSDHNDHNENKTFCVIPDIECIFIIF